MSCSVLLRSSRSASSKLRLIDEIFCVFVAIPLPAFLSLLHFIVVASFSIIMNVISNTDSNSSSSSHGRKEADKSVLNDGMRTRIVSSGMSGSSLTDDDDRFADDEMAVIAAPPEVAMFSTAEDIAPAEIPPEPSGTDYTEDDNNHQHHNEHEDAEEDNDDLDRSHDPSQTSHVQVDEVQEEDDESEYEYEEDDDAAFSGFLMTGQTLQLATNAVSQRAVEPARIREDDDEEEEEEVTSMVETMEESPTNLQLSKQQPSAVAATSRSPARKPKWREPSRDAVNMSLRAERETTGGKRRLAQDLYRIMNQDTEEAGFSLQPKSEDAMDKWTIKLFQFDEDSNLAKDMVVLGLDHIELEMSFPEHYPFEPPFVRVVRPRFKRQTGFVMNGALCMELLTKDGWNPVNDIESVIVSIRSLLVVGDGRLQHACDMPKAKYETILAAAKKAATAEDGKDATRKRQRSESGEQQLAAGKNDDVEEDDNKKEGRASKKQEEEKKVPVAASTEPAGAYSMAEAMAAYTHLSDYHAKKGWDNSGWWSRKG